MSIIHSNDLVTTWTTGLVPPVRPEKIRVHIELERRDGGAVMECAEFALLDDSRVQVETLATLRNSDTVSGAYVCQQCLGEALLRTIQR